MIFRQLFDASTSTYTYLIADPVTREAVLIDPVREQVERDLRVVRELGLDLKYVLDTHVHADHVTGAGALRRETGAMTVGGEKGAGCADVHVNHNDTLRLGNITITALSTPGHTDDSLSYLVDDMVFTGDALLIRGCGRTDFQNGDPSVLYDSITRVLFSLPDETKVYPGHDYRGHTMSTIGEEKAHNPRIADKSREQFVEIMNTLNLPNPKQILEAVPANRACGVLDPGVAKLWELAETVDGVPQVAGEAATQMLGKVRFIDVREPHEFNEAHIPGSELVPLRTVADAAEGWTRDAPLLLVCRSGRRSMEAAKTLKERGFTRLLNLRGGVTRWREAGYDLETPYAQVV